MENILNAIKAASAEIFRHLAHNSTFFEKDGNTNASGDEVHKIDLLSNEIIKEHLKTIPEIYALASEEEEELVYCNKESGKYLVAFDPLDGSGNIDPGLDVGSIFGIYEVDKNSNNLLESGQNIVGAAYTLFGATLKFMFASDGKVLFEEVSNKDEIIRKDENFKMSNKNKFYCVNEANRFNGYNPEINRFLEKLAKKKMGCRWGGCMVQDVHRILIQGGVFCYPSDKKNVCGKLRLLYECLPMGYIVLCAGGRAYLEDGSYLLKKKIDMQNLHEKIPVYLMTHDLGSLFLETLYISD
jgi:fructose-1,6-bisphosphatase I